MSHGHGSGSDVYQEVNAVSSLASSCVEAIRPFARNPSAIRRIRNSTQPVANPPDNKGESQVRLIKMLGLAVVAAIASMAVVGIGTASAGVHESIGFCLQNEGLLCAPANLIDPPEGGLLLILAHAELAELKNNAFFSTPEKCKSDTGISVKGKTALHPEWGTMHNPILGEVVELTFTECSGPCKKAEAQGLPWKGKLQMSSPTGTWDLVSEEGGALLSECTFGTSCKYGVPTGGTVTLKGEDTLSGAVTKAEGVELKYQGGSGEGVCGSKGTWTASYAARPIHLKNSSGGDIGLHEHWWYTLLGNVNTLE